MTADTAQFDKARAAYLRELNRPGARMLRMLANVSEFIWRRCTGGLVLLWVLLWFSLGLCAVEVPDRILVGICAVETGTEWRGIGDVRGKWSRGADGEVSPFQLSIAALSDMGVTNISRVHRDTVWAESLARLWLSRCFDRHGNWPDAVAAYNAGSRYRSRSARDYARRVIAIAENITN